MRLTILRGVPASGKSTFAGTEPDAVVVNRDSLRYSMYGRYFGGNINEDVITQVEDAAIEAGLRAGSDVIVDATNLERKRLKTKLSLASRYGADVVFKDFPISQADATQRDAEREFQIGRGVGAAVIAKFFKRYKINPDTGVLPAPPEPLPTFEPYTPDTSLSYAYVFDIDGTLANHEGQRNPYDTSKYHLDTPHMHVTYLTEALFDAAYAEVILLSGRDAEFRPQTVAWLEEHNVYYTALHMRPKGDRRIDSLVKYELFKQNIEPKYNVLGVFDDRPQVIRMWETIGVPVFNVGTGVEF